VQEKQMEEQRRVALAKIQEREMLEKLLVDKLLAEDSKEKESLESKEDEGPELLYMTRKRLVELGHWTNDPFVKKVSSSRWPDRPHSMPASHLGLVYAYGAFVCVRVKMEMLCTFFVDELRMGAEQMR
jgi:hypothetical protein